jgi:hypothetical protein
VFDSHRPAVAGMLDELARSGIGADWGARKLSRESKLYEPLGYNTGAAWPFLTGFAGLAEYVERRGSVGWQYLDGTADLTFLEPRGYMPELFSGDRLRTIDAAVPHQLFATTGFVSMLLRGMLGIRECRSEVRPSTIARGALSSVEGRSPKSEVALHLAPQLPANWPGVHIANLRWQQAVFDLDIEQQPDATKVRVTPRAGTVRLDLELPLPLGGEWLPDKGAPFSRLDDVPLSAGTWLRADLTVAKPETLVVRYRPGVALVPLHAPLAVGDTSTRLRLIDARFENGAYTARVQGLNGRTYRLQIDTRLEVTGIEAAPLPGGAMSDGAPQPVTVREVSRDGTKRIIELAFAGPTSAGATEWTDAHVIIRTRRAR